MTIGSVSLGSSGTRNAGWGRFVADHWPAILAVAAMAGLAAVLTLFDSVLADLVPDSIWRLLHMEHAPIRALPLVLVALAGLVGFILWQADTTVTGLGLFFLLAASQANGLAVGPIDSFDVAVLGLFLVWITRLLRQPDTPLLVITPVTTATFFMLVIALTHIMVERNVGNFARGMISMIRMVMLTIVVVNLIDTREKLEQVIRLTILVATLSAIIGIIQFGLSYFAGISLTFINPPETAFKPTPLGFVMRASGLCITAQHMSGFLLLTLPFALRRLTDRWHILDFVCVGLLCLGILVTWNFGAVLAVGVIVLLFPFNRWPAFSIHVAAAYALIAATAYYSGLAEWAYDTLQGMVSDGKGVHQRMTLMLLGVDKLDRSIWWGTGMTDFANFSGNYWGRPVHNAYLQAFTELGLFGFLTFVGVCLLLLTLTIMQCLQGGDDSVLQRSFVVVLVTLMWLMMTEPMLDHSNTWLFLSLAQIALMRVPLPREAAVPVPAR